MPEVVQHATNPRRPYQDALANLARLHILPQSPVKHSLNPTFKASMRQAITGGYDVPYYL